MNQSCSSNNIGCSWVQIVQSADVSFFARLFYTKTGEPFNLTGVTEIVASFPGSNGVPVKKTYTSGAITVVGSPGAGKIQIALSTIDTELMQANPQIKQNLQIIVTIAGVAQEDSLSFDSPPEAGTAYVVTLNGTPFSYVAKSLDTAEDVFEALSVLIEAGNILITPEVTGSDDSALMSLTSSVPGLAFSDQVSSGMSITNITPNGGTRTVFLLQQVLNIQPQDYLGS